MNVTLTHEMRLNVIAVMDQQPCKIATIRKIWDLQDRIKLTDAESEALGVKKMLVAGAEQIAWDRSKTIPAQEFALTDQEVALIREALDQMDVRPAYRAWLEPLMKALETEQPRPVAVPRKRG